MLQNLSAKLFQGCPELQEVAVELDWDIDRVDSYCISVMTAVDGGHNSGRDGGRKGQKLLRLLMFKGMVKVISKIGGQSFNHPVKVISKIG
nr:hypothetical protein [Tanacetum cinerariifolium]